MHAALTDISIDLNVNQLPGTGNGNIASKSYTLRNMMIVLNVHSTRLTQILVLTRVLVEGQLKIISHIKKQVSFNHIKHQRYVH